MGITLFFIKKINIPHMKRIVFLVLFIGSIQQLAAQRGALVVEKKSADDAKVFSYPKPTKKDRYNVAVLTPLYLDSVDLGKNLTQIPKFMMPGIDFYQGVMIATDTLKKQGFKLDLYIYDSKSLYLNVKNLIESDKLDSMDLIIGNASISDLKLLADYAKKKLINFVSAVSPSDAGQEFNPYFTILQPRLASHIEKMHKHLITKYPEDNVVFVHRNQSAEKNALGYFKSDILNSIPSRFSEMEMNSDDINIKQLLSKIDSNYNTTIVLGILDASVTYKTLKALQPLGKRHKLKVYCMPTTEAIKALGKTEEFPDLVTFYTTSYIIDKITPASLYITKEYKRRMGSTPSDVVYKGFESLYFFSNLMKKYGIPFNERIGDNAYTFITPYKIVPVKELGEVKFYENKFLYLVRYEDGIMTYE
jgi:ABC-type branched-subunit amino acid transport system substrate-binding protein